MDKSAALGLESCYVICTIDLTKVPGYRRFVVNLKYQYQVDVRKPMVFTVRKEKRTSTNFSPVPHGPGTIITQDHVCCVNHK